MNIFCLFLKDWRPTSGNNLGAHSVVNKQLNFDMRTVLMVDME